MSELRFLKWADIDIAGKKLVVRKSKSKRPRAVWLNKPAVAALRGQRTVTGEYPHVFPGGRVRADGKSGKGAWDRTRARRERWWLTALEPLQRAIPKFQCSAKGSVGRGWHLLRHTFASRLAQRNVSIYKISEWLGHSDIRTTMIYAHLSPKFDVDIELASVGGMDPSQGAMGAAKRE